MVVRYPWMGVTRVSQDTPDKATFHRSPHMSPRAVMIAQDFARVRVLASGSIAAAYGVASMCAHAGKRPARARQRCLFLAQPLKIERTSLKCNDLYSFNKRLGDICGLGRMIET